MYQLAHTLWEERETDGVFLGAERKTDGRRTFKLLPGEPSQTSFGTDLYHQIFREEPALTPG